MPFFIEDLTPTEIRVPFRQLSTHPNGVTGIRRLVLPGDAKAAFERALGRVFRTAPGSMPESAPLGSVTIESCSPPGVLKAPYRLELSRPGSGDADLEPNKTFGVPIKLVGR